MGWYRYTFKQAPCWAPGQLFVYIGLCLVTLTVTTIHTTKKTQKKSGCSPQYDFHFPLLRLRMTRHIPCKLAPRSAYFLAMPRSPCCQNSTLAFPMGCLMHPACQHLVGSDAADCKAILFRVLDAAHCSDDGKAILFRVSDAAHCSADGKATLVRV